jgi:hypothetical protein
VWLWQRLRVFDIRFVEKIKSNKALSGGGPNIEVLRCRERGFYHFQAVF